MARFIEIKQKDGDLVLINTDYVVMAKYHDNGGMNTIVIEVAKNNRIESTIIDFETKAEVIDFLQKNFLLFNS